MQTLKRDLTLQLRTIGLTALFLSSGMAMAKPTVPPIVVSNVSVDKTSIQAGETVQVSYVLSQTASQTGIVIEFLSGSTVLKSVPFVPPAPEALAGAHSVLVDTKGMANGAYSVRVSAPSGSTATFVDCTDKTNPLLHFYNPRGVDVNKVSGSPAYGRIYVSEGQGGATTGRTTTEGVYMINPDFTEPFPDMEPKIADSGSNGGAWASSSNSPFRVTVGPDGLVYITDWSDPHAGLFIADADGNQVDDLLAYPNPDGGQRSSGGLTTDADGNALYGSMSAVWVEGTGANRKLFATMEDIAGTVGGKEGNCYEYDIPAGQTHWGTPPRLAVENWDPAGSKALFGYTYQDVVRDSQGNFYITDTDTGTLANEAYKFDSTGALVATLPATGASYYGIAIDEAHNRILLAANGGRIYQTDKSFATVSLVTTLSGDRNRDIAFDGEGWLYVVNSSAEQLYVLAPPGTAVTGGNASAPTTLNVVSPIPGDVAPVDTTGIFVGPNGHRYGDGKVDMADAIMALKIAAGLAQVP